MHNKNIIIKLMQDCMNNLFSSEMIAEKVIVEPGTPLFGNGSNLDSMAFVTFITDVEERITQITKEDLFIVLSDIEELFPNAPCLTADMFADYLLGIVEFN